MQEPKRNDDINGLQPYLVPRFNRVFAALERLGHHPLLVEGRRVRQRQAWLYGAGRSRWECIKAGISPFWSRPKARRVTWTMKGKHLQGKAGDVIDRYTKYDDPKFFAALKREGAKEGLYTIPQEGCHLEWR